MTKKLTKAQREALDWFYRRNGDGQRIGGGLILAAGEVSPFQNTTWMRLEGLELIERYGPGRRRYRITPAGRAALGGDHD